MLSNTRQVHASLHPKRANNVKTSCKKYCLLCVLTGFLNQLQFHKSFLRTFLKLCSNSVHFKKRQSIEQAFSKCQEHNAGHAVGALKSILPFLHKFHPFLPDDTIFVENMKRYAQCLKNHSCILFFHRFLPRKLSTNTVVFLLSAIFPIIAESQHNFLRHRDLSRDLLTVSSIHRLEVENATFWSAKNITKKSFWPKFFLQWCFIRSEQ